MMLLTEGRTAPDLHSRGIKHGTGQHQRPARRAARQGRQRRLRQHQRRRHRPPPRFARQPQNRRANFGPQQSLTRGHSVQKHDPGQRRTVESARPDPEQPQLRDR